VQSEEHQVEKVEMFIFSMSVIATAKDNVPSAIIAIV
jgi:hypothetical protein